MKPLVYKLDIESALSMEDLRRVYKNKDRYIDPSSGVKYGAIGEMTKESFRGWAKDEDKKGRIVNWNLFHEDFFNRLATAKNFSGVVNLTKTSKNRKLAPFRVFLNVKGANFRPIPEGDNYFKVRRFLEEKGLEIEDYFVGLCREKSTNRLFKIGRFLSKEIAKGSESEKEEASYILKLFVNDEERSMGSKGEYKLMFSRHPMDIIGAGTTSSWESCLNLIGKRVNQDYSLASFRNGAIVAFLVKILPPGQGKVDSDIKFVGRKLIYPAYMIPYESRLYNEVDKHDGTISIPRYQEDGTEYSSLEYQDMLRSERVRKNTNDDSKLILNWLYDVTNSKLGFPLYSDDFGADPINKNIALVASEESYGTWNDKLDRVVDKLLFNYHNKVHAGEDKPFVGFIPMDMPWYETRFVSLVPGEYGFKPLHIDMYDNEDDLYLQDYDDYDYDEEEPLDEDEE